MDMRWRGLGTEVVQGSNLSPASLRMWIFEIVVGDRAIKLEVFKQWLAGSSRWLYKMVGAPSGRKEIGGAQAMAGREQHDYIKWGGVTPFK